VQSPGTLLEWNSIVTLQHKHEHFMSESQLSLWDGLDEQPSSGLIGPRAVLRSEDEEWWTPPEYIQPAREVMGGINLDPASCAGANVNVCADQFYDKAQNGLVQPWFGRIWMNPPYNRLAPKFVRKLFSELTTGRVEQAVLLLNSNAMGSGWFEPLFAYPVCVKRPPRIDFIDPNGKTNSTHGSVCVYIGPRREASSSALLRSAPFLES
jgi:ParB family chromosome partitioning protein